MSNKTVDGCLWIFIVINVIALPIIVIGLWSFASCVGIIQ